MNTAMVPQAGVRDYLAAERTFLAWVRTGLALMGFGFVVARFGLFLQEFAQRIPLVRSYGLSLWFGTAFIVVGVIVNVFAARRHARLMKELAQGETTTSRGSGYAVAIAVFLALIGLAMAVFLLSVRNSTASQPKIDKEVSMTLATAEGIISKQSNHSVDETVQKFKTVLHEKGVTLFALIDHSGEAEKAGMKMPPTRLLIFGNPKAGTPLMQAAPTTAIDLPLKVLIWEDAQKKVWVSYNSPEYLQQRHGFPKELLTNIAVAGALAQKAAE